MTRAGRAGVPFNRRTLFVMGGSALLLSACQADPRRATPVPGPAKTPAISAQVVSTVDTLLSAKPFYIGHRGSGDNWPEHTREAYSKAVELGAQAIEISVNATSDGVLVCHHDKSTLRSTGQDLIISETTWAELSTLRVDARDWLGPAAEPQPIPRLDDVLDLFAATHVIFIEDKQGTNAVALLDLMDTYPDATSHFVWKQWGGAGQYALAAERGYKCWGYFGPELFADLDRLAGRFDYLGVPHTASDAEIARVVAFGKPVIAWEIHYRWMKDRMGALGVAGLMCSNLPYVAEISQPETVDHFASGLRTAGDLPWTTDKGWGVQPAFVEKNESISLSHQDIQSYLMGSMSPSGADTYRIQCELCWPDTLPQAREHAGIAFGADDDRPYRVRIAGEVSAYHVILRPTGSLELFRRAAGDVDGTLLGSVDTTAARAGQWVQLEVAVTPVGITVYRLDGRGWSFETKDAAYRGSYFWLCKNYRGAPPVEFRAVKIL